MPIPIKAGAIPPSKEVTSTPRIMAVNGIITPIETIASAKLKPTALLCALAGSIERRLYMISGISLGINLCARDSINCSLYSGLIGLCVKGGCISGFISVAVVSYSVSVLINRSLRSDKALLQSVLAPVGYVDTSCRTALWRS